ncbi:MAG TPA: cobaltochelatase subunit CobN [Methanomicrobiales archaeon]|nr:cobaltochelatase subunit CobN [Methanomicrobiales archaeon]
MEGGDSVGPGRGEGARERTPVVAILYDAYLDLLREAARDEGLALACFGARAVDLDPGVREAAVQAINAARALLLHRTSHAFWDELEGVVQARGRQVPVVCVGSEPDHFSLSNVTWETLYDAYAYLTYSGPSNMRALARTMARLAGVEAGDSPPPAPIPWQGIHHPESPHPFRTTDEYLTWYKGRDRPLVGLLISRTAWVTGKTGIEDTMIHALEDEGLGVLPVFTYAVRDDAIGSKSMAEVAGEFFLAEGRPRVRAMVKMVSFLMGAGAGESEALLRTLDVPVFAPVISYYQSLDEWEAGNGLSTDVGWSIALPECEGVIEPILAGASSAARSGSGDRIPIPERCRRVAGRVRAWVTLGKKPVAERRVAFILHASPCSGLESSIGSASGLDAPESVARILRRMKEAGYFVDPPGSGKEIVDLMLEKRAIAEFRWTTAADIAGKGGAIARIPPGEYASWFATLSPRVQEEMVRAWGEPPGTAMVHGGEILVTGLSFGNALVCLQPKRGCAGPRCDGQVCKILHDPLVPPTHQYLATYRWLEHGFGADIVVHVGTHGSMEFLPGKGAGLSPDCYPDIAIGTLPHLYLYSADNPAEATVAKRRGCATLIGHMPPVMAGASLYGELAELDDLLTQYETARHDPARAHALAHLIRDAMVKANLHTAAELSHSSPLDQVMRTAHEALALVRSTRVSLGLHVFGEVPEGEAMVRMVYEILRSDEGEDSIRRFVAARSGLNLDALLADPGGFSAARRASNSALVEEVDSAGKDMIRAVFDNNGLGVPSYLETRIRDLAERIQASREMESFLHASHGGFVPPGPAGLLTRGGEGVLPTGRNLHSLDPARVPTKAAWRVGQRLADRLIARYRDDHGSWPETAAFYWMASDLVSADGEGLAQMFALLGVEPVWDTGGRVKGSRPVPLTRLGRPRVDIAVRISGIIRDNFGGVISLLDDAVRAVAALEEEPAMNAVRRHVLAALETGEDLRGATTRIFGSMPGTYTSGVNLAVLASAWREEKDLAEIYLATNGYAYGRGLAGKEGHRQFARSLGSVSLTFNKVASDEHDLLGCCCYYGNHGGMTAAARHLTGKDVKAYYGDTRDPHRAEVRTLADEIRRVVQARLLNPAWIDGMKAHGYRGASEMTRRITRVYGWEASTREVDDGIFDSITRTFVLDPENREFFRQENPWGLEEIARRLLEAERRGLWEPDPEVKVALEGAYLEIESWMEDRMAGGDIQGGSVEIYTAGDVADWSRSLERVLREVHRERAPVRRGDSGAGARPQGEKG